MGERDNHIATRTSPRPWRKLLTHGHGEEEVDDGVDGEVQPREEAAAGGGHGGGGGEEETAAALGAAAPWPPFFLVDGAAMVLVLPSKTAAWEEENSWPLVT